MPDRDPGQGLDHRAGRGITEQVPSAGSSSTSRHRPYGGELSRSVAQAHAPGGSRYGHLFRQAGLPDPRLARAEHQAPATCQGVTQELRDPSQLAVTAHHQPGCPALHASRRATISTEGNRCLAANSKAGRRPASPKPQGTSDRQLRGPDSGQSLGLFRTNGFHLQERRLSTAARPGRNGPAIHQPCRRRRLSGGANWRPARTALVAAGSCQSGCICSGAWSGS
jgi:hypothetical protein